METSAVIDAGGRAVLATAVASVAGLVDELAGVVARRPDALDGPTPFAGADADPLQDFSEVCLDGLGRVARLEAATAALKVRLVAAYAEAADAIEGPPASAYEATAQEMSRVAEVACMLTIGERAASALLGEAHALTTSLPAALDALQAGTIGWLHARIVVEETTGLTPAAASALEAHFFDADAPKPAGSAAPGDLVPARFRRKVRAWRERHHPESLEERHAKSTADRRVEFSPDRDGMAWLSLYLPGDTALAIWNKSTALARGLQGPDEPRNLSQLRADVAAGLLLGSANQDLGDAPSPKVEVLVTVPVFSLLGLADEPAEVDGLGPVPASLARRLVADGASSLYRVLVDPRDGAPLEIGRTSYRLPEALKRWLKMRDGRCTFPGCSNHSLDNEADHLTAWQRGGTTGISNLGQACPKHHRLKHGSAWTPTPATTHEPPGWISPAGRHYPAEHPDREPPLIPSGCLPVTVGPLEQDISPLEQVILTRLAA
ncbi:HNH endonuclease [Pseudarthrobacter phenanthrenivorans Sphe3]|uniref:HNH endonuclease n=1 Tax=Pseudarthrobacter phenanthrenivorans (strain DSM 18606 / JCM 16027 / LMG 23796 / Sphe3) TaxID=930171 RepID=F0M4K1_PSEPM|nr:HNH endonuclease signature motif containing protein [Pseudarthrobacter phenanthrenivorans]ADX74548.1 HNH endonuclease [Pseudarthrobacter phenanthrenivorans Sphe3]